MSFSDNLKKRKDDFLNRDSVKALLSDKWKLTAVLSLAGLIVSLAATVFLMGRTSAMNSQLKQQSAALEELSANYNTASADLEAANKKIYDEQKKNNILNDQYKALKAEADEAKEKAKFLDDYIVIVGRDRTFFHRNDCKLIESDTFWAFNIDAAFEMGFRPCRYCMY